MNADHTTLAVLARAVADAGCTTLVGVLGEGNIHLVSTLVDTYGVRYVAARHEAGAVAMADGYARVTGTVGFCTVSHGPALTNALTPLAAAARNGTPLVLLAGALPTKAQRHAQYVAQRPLAEAVGAVVLDVDGRSSADQVVAEAIRVATTQRRPVLVNCYTDQLTLASSPTSERGTGADASAAPVDPAGVGPAPGLAPAPDDLAAAAEAISRSTRPLVLAGRGAVDARQPLIELADHCGALLGTTLLANGLFAGHPWHVGAAGGLGNPRLQPLIDESDCIIAFGASLNHLTTSRRRLTTDATVVHVDVDPSHLGAYVRADHAIVADAAAAATALRPLVTAGQRVRSNETAERLARARRQSEPEALTTGPDIALATIDRILPEDRQLVVDGGHCMGYACHNLSVRDPRSFILSVDFGALGLGVAMAVGAAIARPGRRTVLAAGDGGFLMGIHEVETAVRLALPIVFLITNDRAYGAEVYQLDAKGLPADIARFAGPGLADLARGYGMPALTWSGPADAPAVGDLLARTDGPLLVEIPANEPMDEWFAALLT